MDTPNAIAARIANFAPKSLTRSQWALAASAARALVLAAGPTTEEDAKCLLSSLCTYLATSCGWDRDSEPDLAALLRDASIEAFKASFTGHSRTADNHVGRLRSLQRALVGIKRVAGRSRSKTQPASRAVRAVHQICATASVAMLAAVAEESTGRPLTAGRLAGLAGELTQPTGGNVTGSCTGTVRLDRAALGAYLQAADCEPSKGVVRATKPNRTDESERTSRRQQLRAERAERAAIRRLRTGPRLAPDPDPDLVSPEVRAAIEGYRPADLTDAEWAGLRPLTCRLVLGYRPPSVVSARNTASIVVPFLQWVSQLADRPEPNAPPNAYELLAAPLVEEYAGPEGSWMRRQSAPAETIRSARTALRRAVRSLDADRQVTRFAYTPIDPPYSPEECDQLAWLASTQPTPTKERNACYLVGLGLGAGLSATDLRMIRRRHITSGVGADGREYLVVTVPGVNGRAVPVRDAYADLVRRALELSEREGPDGLVLGKKATRRNVTYVASHGIVSARDDDPVVIQPHRLRTTWLFACMNAAVPLADLLRLAGLKSARSLADLLPLCAPADPRSVERMVAKVRDATVHSARTAVAP